MNLKVFRLFFCLGICVFSFLNAQERFVLEDQNFVYECDCRNWTDGLFVSVGLSSINSLKINDYLEGIGAPEMPNSPFWVGLGWSFRGEENLHNFDFLVSVGDANSQNENFRTNYRESDIMFRYYRKIFQNSQGSFISLGAQTSFTISTVNIRSRNSTIDLDETDFVATSQNISQDSWMFGPSLSFNWISGEKRKLIARFLLSYDFSFYTSKWQVIDATTNANSFEEIKDRIQLSIVIPIISR